jgi:hypothetical protein
MRAIIPLIVTSAFSFFQATPEPTGAAAIKEALLYGLVMPAPSRTAGLPADVERSLAAYRECERAFEPTIARPPNPKQFTRDTVYAKRVGVERAVYCAFDRPAAAARAYATDVRLLYEWEGYADGPLTEAASADAFLKRHPDSPVAPYAHLFAGHRKLCAVSGFDGLDRTSPKARDIARDADRQLAIARDQGPPLVHIVAEHLLATRKCFDR